MNKLYSEEDKVRIVGQVQEMWASKLPDATGEHIIAVRFDQSDTDEVNIAIIMQHNYSDEVSYSVGWSELCWNSELQQWDFTEDSWYDIAENGASWEGYKEDYDRLIEEVYPTMPEWEHVYL